MQVRGAAVVYGPGDDPDAVLAEVVSALRRAGRSVGGLLQHFGARLAPGKREMILEVLPSGEMIRLNDQRGSGVQGCILNADALARASMAFRQAALDRPDLLVAARFGKEEAAGGGLRGELGEALLAGVPVLVAVRGDLLSTWQAFLAMPAEVLPVETHAVLAWAGLTDQPPARRPEARATALRAV